MPKVVAGNVSLPVVAINQDPRRLYSELNSLTGVLAPNYGLVDEHKKIVEAYK